MRITAATLYRDTSAALERSSEQLLEYQRQVASGKRIERPSDDPSGMAQAVTERNELASIEQYQRTSDSVASRLTIVDTTLSDIIERLTEAQTAAIAGRGSLKTPAQREVAAQTLEGAKRAIFENLNTSFHGTYLFAGADSVAPPFVMGPGNVVSAYQGSNLQVEIEVDEGRSVAIAFDGSAVTQGTAATDLFADFDALIAAVRTGDEAATTQGIAALEAAFNRTTTVQTRVGVQMNAVETQQAQLVTRRLASLKRVADNENVDMAKAMTGMTQAETAYNAALTATSRIAQRSLMDYLS